MNRFSKENIDKLVLMPEKGLSSKVRDIAGPIIDNSGLISAIGIAFLYFVFNLPSTVLFFSILFFCIQIYFWYLAYVKFYDIKVNEYKVDLKLGKEVQFIFVSDFHVGKEYENTNLKRLRKIIDTINGLKQDLILLGGDFLTQDLEPELLAELKNIKGKVYAVYGNHDAYYLEDKVEYTYPQEFIAAFEKSNIPLLINQNKTEVLNGVKINIIGIPDLYSKIFNLDIAMEGISPNGVNILLAHNPDTIDFVAESDNIDLILSGHNHSGQIHVPIYGPVLPMPTKRRWLTKGVFQVNKRTKLLLSQGVGNSGSRLRIGTQAEVCLVTIY